MKNQIRSLSKIKHGLCRSKQYKTWCHMVQRCRNPKNKSYKHYGARGITVFNEWENDFISFFVYIMGLPNAGEDGYTIDRIDNDGNYEPGNIRWATKHEQRMNQSGRSCDNKYIGVYRQNGGYLSRITVNGKDYVLGTYKKEEDAAAARDVFIIENNLREYKLQIIKDATL
jgi:hypothetical protein